eukprot:TRINITY_DN102_c0_g1_i1.p1 TRINITY_DN102_c0_g1~~TRINITY_DN102_c0_g1_i1.p1  ORF type:complete len:491 (+),score=52.15 TRINITY_DN102_c0_g1_i1:1352-2824(+)
MHDNNYNNTCQYNHNLMSFQLTQQLIMINSLLILLLVTQALSLKPSLKADINNPMLTSLKDLVVKDISNHLNDIPLPDFEKDIVVATIKGTNITMNIVPFTGSQIQIELIEGTNDFYIKGTSLSLNGSMDLGVTVLFVNHKCKGFMEAKSAGFVARVGLVKNDTRLAVEVKSVALDVKKENVDIRIEGNIVDSIMNVMAKFLKTFFFESIKSSMAEMLPEVISDTINEILGDLPDDVVVTPGLAVRFIFTSAPAITSGYMVTPLLVYMHPEKSIDPPVESPPELPDYDPSCKKGIQVFFSDYIIRTAVNAAHQAGMLKFEKTVKALGFHIDIKCSIDTPPAIEFNGSISFNGNVSCEAEFTMKSPKIHFKLGFIPGISAVLSERIENSTMHFNIAKMVIISLKIIYGKEIDVNTLLSMLNLLLEDFRKHINKEIDKKGIPLPVFKNFDISDMEQTLVDRYIFMCGNLKPKGEGFNFAGKRWYRSTQRAQL